MKTFIVGITGASGSIYAVKLIETLLSLKHRIFLVITKNGKKVIDYEMDNHFDDMVKRWMAMGNVTLLDNENMFAPIASGSFKTDGMIILPASMGTISKIKNGMSDQLLTRAADVCIKEKRRLIVVPRETPLSTIHLENLHYLSLLNVHIVPPMPAFYQHPTKITDIVNDTVGRLLTIMDVEHALSNPWEGKL